MNTILFHNPFLIFQYTNCIKQLWYNTAIPVSSYIKQYGQRMEYFQAFREILKQNSGLLD